MATSSEMSNVGAELNSFGVPLPQISSSNITKEHSAYVEWKRNVTLCHDLMGGTRAMRQKCSGYNKEEQEITNNDYLPREEAESLENYHRRVSRSFLFNAFKRTVQRLTGEPFKKKINLNPEASPEMEEFVKSVDKNRSEDITRYAYFQFMDGLIDGSVHTLVDYDNIQTRENENTGKREYYNEEREAWLPFTASVEKQRGLEPYLYHIKMGQLFNWIEDNDGNLIQIRILEKVEERENEFEVNDIQQIRVIEPGRWAVYRSRYSENRGTATGQTKQTEWYIHDQGTMNAVNYIPIETWFCGRKKSRFTAEIPLEGLAELNLMHFQSSSDQRNILHYARIITFFGRELKSPIDDEEKDIVVGGNRVIHGYGPNADLKIVEHSGAGINSGRQDLEDLKAEMALFGLTLMLPQRTGEITATSHAIDAGENDSVLKGWTQSFEDYMNAVINIIEEAKGVPEGSRNTSISIHKDFTISLQNADLSVLIQAYEAGILSREVVIDEFKRRGLIKEEWDIVDIKKEVENDRRDDFSTLGALDRLKNQREV